jgi:sulfofructose kinase
MRWDILGVGSATVDDLLFVPTFPQPDTKNRLDRVERHGGGLVATALVAAARLGARAAFAGMLGDDDVSQWIEADLAREGVDISTIVRRADSRPIHAFIIVEQGTGSRTILYTMPGRTGADAELPNTETITQAHVLFIDDVGGDLSLYAGQIARVADIPIVADFEWTENEALIALPDHLIVSERFAARVTGASDPVEAAHRLWHSDRAAVVVTCGERGCWYLSGDSEPTHQPSIPVQVVDTTGCGDVFHGAYAAALTWGFSLPERVRFATAAAALKATKAGGRQGIPTRSQVEALLAANPL